MSALCQKQTFAVRPHFTYLQCLVVELEARLLRGVAHVESIQMSWRLERCAFDILSRRLFPDRYCKLKYRAVGGA